MLEQDQDGEHSENDAQGGQADGHYGKGGHPGHVLDLDKNWLLFQPRLDHSIRLYLGFSLTYLKITAITTTCCRNC